MSSSLSIAKPGAILLCKNWLPYPEKMRPVLVLRLFYDLGYKNPWVLIAYGTAQPPKSEIGAHELTVPFGRISRLTEETRFNLKSVIPLELSSENFKELLGFLPNDLKDEAVPIFNSFKDFYKRFL